MAKKRSCVVDYTIYVAVRIVVCIVQVLSWDGALALARIVAWLAYRVNRRHRLVALDNLRHAFPDLDEQTLDRLVRASYVHLITMLVEILRLPRMLHRHNVYNYIQHAGPDDLAEIGRLCGADKPSLAVLGHFGNWEVMCYVTGLVGFRGGVVARRLDNPYLDRFMANFRRKTGLLLLDKTRDYAQILDFLARGMNLGMVGDQDAGPRGLYVNFFGRPASTFKSIALLCLEYNAPILVMGAARIGHPLRYVIYLEDVIRPEEYAHRPDATRAITRRYTEALERMVRRHPEQYFWLHRRWKHQPQPKRAKQAA